MITIKYIGQCGFIINNDEVSFSIDPVLNDLVDENGVTIRNYSPALSCDEMKVDYIFCTHDHIDHMAEDTLVSIFNLHKSTKFVVPEGCVDLLVEWGIEKESIIGISAGEVKLLSKGNLSVKGISAAHPVHQVDEFGKDHNLIYCFGLEGKKLVHLGDTYLTDSIEKELSDFGKIDVLFPPINGRDEEREAKGIIGNLSCKEAAVLADKLGVELVIPTHFDMIVGNTANPDEFKEYLLKLNPNNRFIIPVLLKEYSVN